MNKKQPPVVSIIMPAYNCSKYINETITSVINQTFHYWEMIIVEDKSTDQSLQIIEKFSKQDERIKVIKNNINRGSGYSRNKAIKISKGTYIAFIDSDDTWDNKKLEKQVNIMNDNKWEVSHTAFRFMNENGEVIKDRYISENNINYNGLLKNTIIACSSGMYNQDLIGKYFMTHHKQKQDYALWLSILKDGYSSHTINEPLMNYRLRPNANTEKKLRLVIKHLFFLMETQKINIIKSLWYTGFYVFNNIKKHYL